MGFDYDRENAKGAGRKSAKEPIPGKHTNTEALDGTAGPRPGIPGKRTATESLPSVDVVDAPAFATRQGEGASEASHQMQFGNGSPLPPGLRTRFEGSLGTNLGDVRVHTDGSAAKQAATVGARAFATGNDISFAAGQYNPGNPEGDRLIAEEVAHTVQQRGATPQSGPLETTTPGDAVEQEAGQAANAMARGQPAQVSSAPLAIARSPDGGAPGPADAGAPVAGAPPQQTPSSAAPPEEKGAAKPGTQIGTWDKTTKISITNFIGFYNSEAEALAAAHSSSAVSLENGRYAAYKVKTNAWFEDFTYENCKVLQGTSQFTSVWIDAPWRAVTTLDGVVLRPSQFNNDAARQQMTPELMLKPGESPFAGFKAQFEDPNKLGRAELIEAFTAAMKKGAFELLNKSQAEVEKKRDQFNSSNQTGPDEFKRIRDTAKKLVKLDAELDQLRAKAAPKEPGDFETADQATERLMAQREIPEKEQERKQAVQDYPMLARQDPREFVDAPDHKITRLLGDDTLEILKDINTARDDMLTGDLDLWGVPGVIDSTIAGCGIADPQRRKLIKDHAAQLAKSKAIAKGIQTAFAIGLGLLATFSTGGLALVAAAGALGLSTYDAMAATKEYAVDKAAANTHLNPEQALAVKDVSGEWKWVALAWVGVGLDIGQVASALKGVKTIAEVGKAAEQLAKGSEDLLKKLKVAANIIGDTEVITETTRGVVALKLGTSVEIKQGMGSQVHILFEVDRDTGRLVVKGVFAGAEATIKDVLAHADSIKLLTRYEGVTGKLREVLERFFSIVPEEVQDLEKIAAKLGKDSQAYASYIEVKKLKGVVRSRSLQLEAGGRELSAEAKEALERDISFFEDEIKRHQEAVDSWTYEKSEGFIAKGEHVTSEALDPARGRMPDFKDPALGIDPAHHKYYYYRRQGTSYQLCTMQDAPDDVIRLSIVDEGGKKTIVKGRKPPTRTYFGPDDAEQAFAHLTANSESFSSYYPALQKAGVTEAEIKAELQAILKRGDAADEMLRGALKDKFRPRLLAWIQDESRLKNLYGADPLWKTKPQEALRKYSHKELMDTTAKLDNKDASRIEELWYADPKINPEMAGALEKQTGIMVGDKLRVPDNICKNDDIVDVKGGASLYDWDQISDYLSRVGKETTTQSGHTFTPQRVRIAALSPQGVKNNAPMMRQYLDKGLEVQIWNTKSEVKTVTAANAHELDDAALDKWLALPKKD